jgi:hypothetical protein
VKVDPHDPTSHGKPLWLVHGERCFPSLLCAKLVAYTQEHRMLPAGTPGPRVRIWGYSVWKGEPGFRTLGVDVNDWAKKSGRAPKFFDSQTEALEELRKLTKPKS